MHRRRELLQYVAAVGLGSLAGCSNPLQTHGGGSGVGATEWAEWLPQELFESGDYERSRTEVYTVEKLWEAFPNGLDTLLSNLEEHFGIGTEQVDTTVIVWPVGLTSSTVTLGSFDAATVLDEVGEEVETYSGYTILRDSLAVADGILVAGDYVRWLIDAHEGTEPNLLEAGAPLEPLAQRLSGQPVTRIDRTPGDPWSVRGLSGTPGDGGALDVTVYLQFPEHDSARSHESTIREHPLDVFPETEIEYDASSLRFDGSVAILEGSDPDYEPP